MEAEITYFTRDNCHACRKSCSTNELYDNFCKDVDGECRQFICKEAE